MIVMLQKYPFLLILNGFLMDLLTHINLILLVCALPARILQLPKNPFNAAEAANFFPTVLGLVRNMIGQLISISAKSSLWLKGRMFYNQRGPGKPT